MKVNYLKLLCLFLCLIPVTNGVAQEETTDEEFEITTEMLEEFKEFQAYSDSLDATFNYEYGSVQLDRATAVLEIPEGYKFLDEEQAKRVLVDVWGNPDDNSTVGMLLKKEESPADISYAIEVSYSDEGYIEDDEAADIDYDDLLEEMQEDQKLYNQERIKLGYAEIKFLGWASPPFYDQENKKLHWAKELNFDNDEINTLNYNVRVLGRRGYMNLNIIGDMDVLLDVQENLDPILESVTFLPGNQYDEFDPDIDEVAAYGIGGLIAGKVLAKVGFFAFLAKFWKFIAIGAVAVFGAFKKRIFGSKEA